MSDIEMKVATQCLRLNMYFTLLYLPQTRGDSFPVVTCFFLVIMFNQVPTLTRNYMGNKYGGNTTM